MRTQDHLEMPTLFILMFVLFVDEYRAIVILRNKISQRGYVGGTAMVGYIHIVSVIFTG
ncbi:hypothetical protein BD769DRAFT_1505875 [Suillus cothurnatus]|nr:hypothetical protein BD769DRAFT_1505875 [Suillus cothurnatus]